MAPSITSPEIIAKADRANTLSLPAAAQVAKLDPVEAAKRLAAFAAVDRHVRKEDRIIGIGSGSTVPYVVERIIAQGEELNRDRVFLPTGFQSKELIIKAGLTLGDVDAFPELDVTIDGADEVDDKLNAIKGGGACQLREKVLAEAAKVWVMVADYRKNSQVLGTNWKQGIPIEVAPFAYAEVLHSLEKMGSPTSKEASSSGGQILTLRMGKAKAGPVVSDNGNFIIDAPFPEERMKKPMELLRDIKMLTGVVEVGLFCDMAEAAYFGNADGSVSVRRAGASGLETIQEKDLDLSSAGAAVATTLPMPATLRRNPSRKGASIQQEQTRALRAYAQDEGHFSLVRNFRLADMITVSNAVCGALTVFLCIRYISLTANLPTPPSKEALHTLYFAHLLPILGFGFDAADGRVARWTGGGSLLGQELDSLADLVSFGVAPATLAYTLGMRHPLDVAALLFFVCAGLARLARFNATVALMPTKSTGSVSYFTGIPIPSSLGLTAFMAWCVHAKHFVGANGALVHDAASKIGYALGARLSGGADLPLGTKVLFGEAGGWGELHTLSFVFLAWGAAMVSKTLRVSTRRLGGVLISQGWDKLTISLSRFPSCKIRSSAAVFALSNKRK